MLLLTVCAGLRGLRRDVSPGRTESEDRVSTFAVPDIKQ
jgi:hypothetical protein